MTFTLKGVPVSMNLLILGAGGHDQVVKEIARKTRKYEKIDFLDDNSRNAIGVFADYAIFLNKYKYAFVAIGNPDIRKNWQQKLVQKGYEIPSFISKSAYVSKSSNIKRGSVIMPKTVVNANVQIGEGYIISAGAIVDHDFKIGQYCHINAGAIIPSYSIVPYFTKVNYGEVYNNKSKKLDKKA